MSNAQAFGGREVEGEPPVEVLVSERSGDGRGEVVAVEQALETVASAGTGLDQAAAVGDKSTELADVDGWDPDLGDEVSDEQASEGPDVVFVGLDASGSDEFDLIGIGNDGRGNERVEGIVEGPGVGGGFDDDGIGREEVLVSPVGEAVDADPAKGQDDLHVGVETTDDEIVFVGIDGDVTSDLIGSGIHSKLLS